MSFIYNLFYWILYFLFHKFSGAHNKPTTDSHYDPAIEHHGNIFYRLLRRWEARGRKRLLGIGNTGLMRVPTIPGAEINREKFQVLTRGKTYPIVIKGFARETPAVKKWSAEFFKSQYGDTSLLTLDIKDCPAYKSFNTRLGCQRLKLADSISRMQKGSKRVYINNVTELFSQHPELVRDLDLHRIAQIDKSITPENYLKVNMFMGAAGTGSSLHCAVGGNFFFNIMGHKTWYLIDPKYHRDMKSTPARDFSFVISGWDINDSLQSRCKKSLQKSCKKSEEPNYEKSCRKSEEFQESGESCRSTCAAIPKFKITLEPGDLLYVPPWWWHHVYNEDFTIGCAVRDHTIYWQSMFNNPTYMTMSPYLLTLHPTFLKLLKKLKGIKFMRDRSMKSDQYIMDHLTK